MRKRTVVQLSAICVLALLLAFGFVDPTGSQKSAQAAVQERLTAPQDGLRRLNVSRNLKVSVDGRVSPREVPDEIAYRLYLKMLASPDASNELAARRRNAFIGRLHLSPEDRAAVNDSLAGLSGALGRLETERRVSEKDSSVQGLARLHNLKSREQTELDTAANAMRGRLTIDGVDKLDSHIRDHVKTRVVIYDSADDAHSEHSAK